MIIGNGLIANSLKNIDSEDLVFFASGVSNSLENKSSEFERDFSLLKATLENNRTAKFIYFSTLSINDQSKQDSLYVLHKKEIENYIKNYAENYLILRIGNIVGKGGNPNTLFNFLNTQITNDRQFVVHSNARRLLIDIDDISNFLKSNCADIKNEIINCAYPYYYNLKEIIEVIQIKTDKKAIYEETNEGDFYKVPFDKNISDFFSGIDSDEYLELLVKKYI